MAPEGSGGAHRTPRSERPDTSPYGRSSAGENVLSKLVTPLRWGIGGIKKTVRGLLGTPTSHDHVATNATASPVQPAAPQVPLNDEAGGNSDLLDVLKQRRGNALTREEANAFMNLLQGAGAGTGNAEAGGAGWVAPVMPPPAPVGLFQTPSSAGPSAARSPAANSDTAFSSIREYLQQNRRAPLTLPNARGVSRPAATGGWGGGGGGGGSGAGGGTPRGGTPASSYRNLYGTQQPVYSLQQPPSILGFSGPGSGARGVSGFGGAGVGNGTPRGGGNGNSYGGFGA
eukprot:CAMPEP_0181354148 /NCGR_PEP_ID=MMETSP1106-20121128/3207_1 /TAXON_ID=81844 /ORGANISM="Mantoniella antarctica, Strain SL-175" /LENGTH=285 /DNA_ID=CAMNT_0023466793 /DNA_START=160 /DNA_END=1014 /DNA_ORIENTATION=-